MVKKLLTRQGNIKNPNEFNSIDLERKAAKIVKYFKRKQYPYYPTDKKYRQLQFDKFMKTLDNKSLQFKFRTFTHNKEGLSLIWSYFRHAFDVKCGNNHTPIDVWTNEVLLTKAIKKLLKGSFFKKMNYEDFFRYDKDESIRSVLRGLTRKFTGTQMVSNFRPVTASMMYKIFCDSGDTVWDMSSGWGGRLLGSIKADINYIGTDPSTKTIEGNKKIAKDFGRKNRSYKLHKLGSEVFTPDRNSLDFAFTSPPYFDTEKYSNEKTQSFIKFNSQEKWKEGFLKKTLENVYRGLKPNKFLAFNIQEVKSYSMFSYDTIQITKDIGFKYVDKFFYKLSSSQGNPKSEPIFIFKK